MSLFAVTQKKYFLHKVYFAIVLQRENDSLQFQLEAYKNEVDVIKSDAKKEMEKFKAQFIARQALQGAMQGAMDNVRDCNVLY